MSRPHICVKLARAATSDAIKSKLATHYSTATSKALVVPLRDSKAVAEVYWFKELPAALRTWVWELFEQNMKAHYEVSHDGWDPEEKRKELFDRESRFIVLRADRSSPPLGYTIFRFDTEETKDVEEADVVYLYELQVEASAQGKGIGRLLMELLQHVSKDWRMDKTMLTVFKKNEQAVRFYEKLGWVTDEIDPSFYGRKHADYRILSKPCE
ncbi:acyl-CoA N-acyltransferase [Leucosporidium creatinivorum]|uniref:N-alpha-acetyltransferase 40 n=1 Tax=Leucosporidium creatinivorum TaxID=106004 RepID=A0A1Y2EU49_9BASI|nr:acyl-CoA N-acyltransferase [Leucosporidium creatinivorum]